MSSSSCDTDCQTCLQSIQQNIPPQVDMAVHLMVRPCSTRRSIDAESGSPFTPRHLDPSLVAKKLPLHPNRNSEQSNIVGAGKQSTSIEQSKLSAEDALAASSLSPEIEMVWPVCLAVGDENRCCSIDVMLDKERCMKDSSFKSDNTTDCMVLVATGAAMDLVASAKVGEDGSAHCRWEGHDGAGG